MDKITTIKQSAKSILTGNIESAKNLINKEYPFKKLKPEGRSYTDKEKYEQFVRDGFIDRYSGEKLVNPGLLKVLSFYMPDTFPYQSHWKMEISQRLLRRRKKHLQEPGMLALIAALVSVAFKEALYRYTVFQQK